jgi:hypothetical protein
MTDQILGNLLGRAVLSYLLVWFVMWLFFSRMDVRQAFRRTYRWYGLLALAGIFSLGIGVAALQAKL